MTIAQTMLPLAQAIPSWWLYLHVPTGIFIFWFGACVGSFLNVVIYRLPAGMSVTTPPSRCPTCGARLKFFSENLPIIGWFLVRGRCRYCGVKISPQYMIIELLMALAFLGLYIVLFAIHYRTPWWGEIGGVWWHANTIVLAWPAFIAWAFLIAGLVAMTVIDARTFTIPPEIPWFVTIAAFVAWPLQALLPIRIPVSMPWPVPLLGWPATMASILGMVGVVAALILLKRGWLRYSFLDYGDYLSPPPDTEKPLNTEQVTAFELVFLLPCVAGILVAGFGAWIALATMVGAAALMMLVAKLSGVTFGSESEAAEQVLAPDYPHARREMWVEIIYLAPCIIGIVGGWWLGKWFFAGTQPPLVLQALGASFAGYLMGGGLIWGIRILGTFAFGREAMGLGDVHLLGAVGAVLGWFAPILIFFLAPFSGLLWAGLSIPVAWVFRKAQPIPYGPHLVLATLAVILLRPGIHDLWTKYLSAVPWPW